MAGTDAGQGQRGLGHNAERQALVSLLSGRSDIRDPLVLKAIGEVPRELFVSESMRPAAYCDAALPIECDQTISQPYVVALMTQLVEARPGRRILEIGTGSGYQAAVLAAAGAEVFSVEIIEALARRAAERFARLGYRVHTRLGDGRQGWPEEGPFDGILVTAAPREVPAALVAQLAPGGRLVVPVGGPGDQELLRLTRARTGSGVSWERVTGVRFVPLTGEVGASFMAATGSDTIGHGLD
ncbi:MAG: protein-L-isoaspartate(D-aspartate) O-methyltransferase [Myxococcales bacterium]